MQRACCVGCIALDGISHFLGYYFCRLGATIFGKLVWKWPQPLPSRRVCRAVHGWTARFRRGKEHAEGMDDMMRWLEQVWVYLSQEGERSITPNRYD
jgi:hypothetical protein